MGTMNELDHLFTRFGSMVDPSISSAIFAAAPSGTVGPNFISPLQVGLGAILVLVNACISVYLELGLEVALAVATVRCVVQLTILGYILVPIFTYDLWWLVIGYSLVMAFVGAYEAVSRPAYSFKGMFAEVLGSILASSSIFLTYAMLLVVRTHPWWDAQYFIPMLGMLLGNCISGISVGLTTLLEELTSGKDKMELLLSMGGSRWEASREMIQRCVKLAMTPVLNQMNVVGIVSIPGMMTGQILGGTDPSQAARYQMIMMFLIAATTGLGSTSAVYAATATIVDNEHRIRPERLRPRGSRGAKLADKLHDMIVGAGHAIGSLFRKKQQPPLEELEEPLVVQSA